MRRNLVLTTNGRFPLLNWTELAGQLLLSVPPPIEHLVGLETFLFTEYIWKQEHTVTEQQPKKNIRPKAC